MRQQFIPGPNSVLFAGQHYGPGLVDVPDEFPKPKGEAAEQTDDALLMQEFDRHKDEFKAWRERRAAGAVNDAGIGLPESGMSNVPGTVTGSNHGAQTGVVEQSTVPEGAAGKQEGDALNPEGAAGSTGAGGRRPGAANAASAAANRAVAAANRPTA